ncbi:hypothetical protein Cme02nite_24450 [Catellatospora methionotrophica]|uniref:Uncharacterized protein n=1 Tax=Catellatospora methionotrophica TaxID=121620 RepID=A0A8J3L9J3_9ACTN|nr:hypothetical protein [Catellatospora methionotrophica]GIG14113.1 hypothetical protein Cme02nite_24450 [Catellatospora methionotrophica]
MGYPEWPAQGDGWGAPQHGAPNVRAGGWPGPADPTIPRQRNAVDRYGTADDSGSAADYGHANDYGQAADAGFHTYVTGESYDGYDDRWPDNLTDTPEVRTGYGDRREEPHRTERDYWTALLWASGFYAVPLLVLIVRALLLSGEPDAACVAAGLGGCESARSAALGDLIAGSPRWGLALLGALAMAAVLRWASDSWRPATIGFCSAVVAGGATTVLLSII